MSEASSNINQDIEVSYSKFSAYFQLTKFRLASLVVFSAVITYFTVAKTFDWHQIIALSIGGFLVTGAANGFNQIIERETDKLMHRTRNRPLPTQHLNFTESLLFCSVIGIGGTVLLWVYTNPLAGILGVLSIVLYALVYTPLKKVSPFSVFIGAFPGALPTLIGAVAPTNGFGQFEFFGLLLFSIQFFWQFPHFWALAWFNSEDYARASFYLLPSKGGKDSSSKFQILFYSVILLVVSTFPFLFQYVGLLSTSAVVICGIALLLQAYNFYKIPSDENAKKLFIVTLIYLPLVQLALMIKL
ncbi:MAG: heme o synthase [Bacteroidia bacterium]